MEGIGSSSTTVNPKCGANTLPLKRSISDRFFSVVNLNFEYKMIDKRSFLG